MNIKCGDYGLKFTNMQANIRDLRGSPWDVVTNVLIYKIVVSEFESQSRCYAYFLTNTLGKCMNPFIQQLQVK